MEQDPSNHTHPTWNRTPATTPTLHGTGPPVTIHTLHGIEPKKPHPPYMEQDPCDHTHPTWPMSHGHTQTFPIAPHPPPCTHLESRLRCRLSLLRAVTLAIVESFLTVTAEDKLNVGEGLRDKHSLWEEVMIRTHKRHVFLQNVSSYVQCTCTSL